ncbi:MAG TPA: Arm DNA-binding domain-containing protein, partial [Methylocella sp.]|nr:Arm DNA-binding domain-containing protein [Methylocella sp.]
MEKRLTALRIAALKKKGVHPDGGGLYLQVTIGADGTPRKSWFFRFTSPETHKERLMGLGSLSYVSLAERAREARDRARAILLRGLDPIEQRAKDRGQAIIEQKLEAARSMTFDQCAESY